MKKNKIIVLFSIVGFIILCLLAVLLYGLRYAKGLKVQIEERNRIIYSLFEQNFVLDKSNLDFILSLNSDSGGQLSHIKKDILQRELTSLEMRKLHEIMQNYTNSVYNKDYKAYSSFFADSVQVFFLKKDFSIKDVFYNMRWYWNTFPNAQIQYDMNSMSIYKNNEGYRVYIPIVKDESDIIGEIRFNNNMKIYYVKDFYALRDKKE
ncbi:hypothetical protein H9626_09230 [Phocaeicola sp. Sa1YUN3]|uniref:Uncharacterized protein n=2 Tax=Phocaeicola faecium TaxID=2762213 RepID=A0ABR8VCJ1_9BACT|nr:hypothetical protein [Phocaeicola faecium]